MGPDESGRPPRVEMGDARHLYWGHNSRRAYLNFAGQARAPENPDVPVDVTEGPTGALESIVS
jgi:hypothetical protein